MVLLKVEVMQPEAFDLADFRAVHEAMSLRYNAQLAAALDSATLILSDKDQLIVADILALRYGPVSKAAAIAYAVERAVLDLTAGDPDARMTSTELRERQAKVRREIDEEVTIERGGDLEILHVHMGVSTRPPARPSRSPSARRRRYPRATHRPACVAACRMVPLATAEHSVDVAQPPRSLVRPSPVTSRSMPDHTTDGRLTP